MGIMGTAKGPHIQALATALQNRGAEVSFVSPQRLTSFIPEPATIITGADGSRENLRDLDALLVRSLPGGSLEQVIYRLDVLHRLEKLGLKVINRAAVLEKTVDKFYTSVLLADAGLPVPKTVVTESFAQAMEAVRKMGVVVVKPLFGSLGTGMVMVEDPEVAYRVFRALELGRYVYYLQEFLPHNNEDYRLFVVGGEVISAMRRRGENWKTNISCGAIAEYVEPDPVLSRLALKTAELLGADYVGVDILISHGQPYIIEANGIPGWTGLQSVTQVDIVGVLAEYALRQVQLAINKD
jgi:ribosomal protein S6--L-glutamate ligase/tetrahydromethanopterin:alpha-L-glutamate ligase